MQILRYAYLTSETSDVQQDQHQDGSDSNSEDTYSDTTALDLPCRAFANPNPADRFLEYNSRTHSIRLRSSFRKHHGRNGDVVYTINGPRWSTELSESEKAAFRREHERIQIAKRCPVKCRHYDEYPALGRNLNPPFINPNKSTRPAVRSRDGRFRKGFKAQQASLLSEKPKSGAQIHPIGPRAGHFSEDLDRYSDMQDKIALNTTATSPRAVRGTTQSEPLSLREAVIRAMQTHDRQDTRAENNNGQERPDSTLSRVDSLYLRSGKQLITSVGEEGVRTRRQRARNG